MSAFNSIILTSWAVFWVFWLLSAFWAKRNVPSGIRRFFGIRVLTIVIAVVLLRFAYRHSAPAEHSTAVLIIGAAVFYCGLALAVWARLFLGSNWGMPMSKKQNPELVTTGPYRFVRHPIYTGLLLAILGTAAGNIYWLALLAVTAVYFVYSARQEDDLMLHEFPAEYPPYKSRTKMMIPFVL